MVSVKVISLSLAQPMATLPLVLSVVITFLVVQAAPVVMVVLGVKQVKMALMVSPVLLATHMSPLDRMGSQVLLVASILSIIT